ncbi:DNA methyltransferase [Thermoleptolyngbya sp. C42_A2020_037]|uniref:Eco57I restriction-modification methylase domain-containing protein n=1 Tax=Thermoleptolyngbya sp. C42_A2020_037 TaxID=2747799 RepID=UPI0019FE348A|nr:DNA methyltransferase [Thermoleptolyngbya sp. C42_A2020_037]MBF2086778.1 Eco57I restriction-modification methylase domain-containing protein [Thermoleptolyngbya sp. C42_A2020_037]
MLQSRQSDELRQSDARGAYGVDDLPSGAIPVGSASQIAPHSPQGTSDLETWAARSYRRLLDILGDSRKDRFANRQPTQPADHAHARMLLLALLCIPLYQQRRLLPVQGQSLKPDEFALDQLLTAANYQHGLAFPVTALPPLSVEMNTALFALLRSLFLCAPYPVARLGQLYEQCLAWAPSPGQCAPRAALKVDGRKARGIYYTPEPLVNYCVSQTLGRLLSAPTQKRLGVPRILDPAAGGGAFLLATYEALLRWVAGWSANSAGVDGATVPPCTQRSPIAPIDSPVDWHTRQQVLLDCIYGVDVDETAIALTRLSLHLKLLEGQPPPGFVLPDLTQNLVCADALLGLDWTTAFPSAAQAGGFDGVLGNPPYIDAAQMSLETPDWRRVCTEHYGCARGNWDLFCIFIERSLELCRPGGMTSLVVPNKLRSAGYAAAARSLLTENTQLVALRDYAQVAVFQAAVYPLVYVARRQAEGQSSPDVLSQQQAKARLPVPYEVMETLTTVGRWRWLYTKGAEWWLGDSQQGGSLMARLQQLPMLGQVASVRGAATVAEAYDLQRWICNHPTPAPGDLRLVNSGTIDPYRLWWGDRPLRYLGDRYLHPILPAQHLCQLSPQRQQQATQPKLIVAGMTRRLECALDESGGVLAGKSTSIIQAPNSSSHLGNCADLLWLLLAILNSSLIHWFFVQRHGGNALQGGYLRVGPPQLRQIPIALGEQGDRPTPCHTLVDLAKQRQQCGASQDLRAIAQLDAQIDTTVYALYNLSAAEIAEIRAETRVKTSSLAD